MDRKCHHKFPGPAQNDQGRYHAVQPTVLCPFMFFGRAADPHDVICERARQRSLVRGLAGAMAHRRRLTTGSQVLAGPMVLTVRSELLRAFSRSGGACGS